MYIDYSFAKVITILGLSIIKAEKRYDCFVIDQRIAAPHSACQRRFSSTARRGKSTVPNFPWKRLRKFFVINDDVFV